VRYKGTIDKKLLQGIKTLDCIKGLVLMSHPVNSTCQPLFLTDKTTFIGVCFNPFIWFEKITVFTSISTKLSWGKCPDKVFPHIQSCTA